MHQETHTLFGEQKSMSLVFVKLENITDTSLNISDPITRTSCDQLNTCRL